ncbi:nucleolar zinc-finger protein, partial [Ceratobasidium sp. UAMH 11750]
MPAFTVQLDDPAGNSWVEFIGSVDDPKWHMRLYDRTPEQNALLGIGGEAQTSEAKHIANPKEVIEGGKRGAADEDDVVPNEEIYVFPGTCSSCKAPLDTMMKRVIIPYFK